MKKELDEALCKDFPLLFRDRHGDMRQTLMCWGFECGDGWEPLIRALCSSLMWDGSDFKNNHVRQNPPTVVQVKEKFGTLRFYANSVTEKDDHLISFAEYLSGTVCEECGATVRVTQSKGGWIRTRCLECHQENGDIPYGN